MTHKHPLTTVTPDFRIDPKTREVIQVGKDPITLMQFDHNSEKLRFECPRYVDGHDMSLTDKVEVHFVNSMATNETRNAAKYRVQDLEVSPDNPEQVNFSWVVDRNATDYVGTLVFSVCFTCLNGTKIEYAWHTLPFSYISIDQGLVNELDESYTSLYLDNLETEAEGRIDQITTATLDRAIKALENSIINDVQSLSARMDTFTKLAEGSTTGDAELIDARVGADGVIYDSAGTAIREQLNKQFVEIGNVKDSIIWESPNKFNPESVTKNAKLDYTNGEVIEDTSGGLVSDYITIPYRSSNICGSYVTTSGVHQKQNLAVAYFDANKDFIVYHAMGNDSTIPTNAKYLRFYITSAFNTAYHRIMLEFSAEMSAFSEYGIVKLLENVKVPTDNFSFIGMLFEGNKKIKLLGDSITHGVGGTDFEENGDLIISAGSVSRYENVNGVCWANMFKTYIEDKFPTCIVKNWGTRSESYHSLTTSVYDKLQQLIEDDDDVVIMMLGTNDRDHSKDIPTMIERACEVIEYVTQEKGKRLILMSSIPTSVANDESKEFHMEDVDLVNSYLANKYGLHHISVYREFIKHTLYSGIDVDRYLADGLHPNDDGYRLMFEIISRELGIATKRDKASW